MCVSNYTLCFIGKNLLVTKANIVIKINITKLENNL